MLFKSIVSGFLNPKLQKHGNNDANKIDGRKRDETFKSQEISFKKRHEMCFARQNFPIFRSINGTTFFLCTKLNRCSSSSVQSNPGVGAFRRHFSNEGRKSRPGGRGSESFGNQPLAGALRAPRNASPWMSSPAESRGGQGALPLERGHLGDLSVAALPLLQRFVCNGLLVDRSSCSQGPCCTHRECDRGDSRTYGQNSGPGKSVGR